MHRKLMRILLPSRLHGEDVDSRHAQRTIAFGLAMVVWVPVFAGLYGYFGARNSAGVIVAGGVVCLLALVSLRIGVPQRWVGCLVTADLLATLCGVAWFSGGSESPAILWLSAVPMLGIVLTGRRGGLLALTVTLLTGSAFVAAHYWSLPVRNELSHNADHFIVHAGQISFIVCVAALTWIFDVTETAAREASHRARRLAEETARAKSQFLANMSHEIRTPINGIVGFTELALAGELASEQREFLQVVRSSADSLTHIINDILDFSKIEAGKLHLERVPFSLRTCIDEALQPFAVQAGEKSLVLSAAIAGEVPDMLIGDPTRLRQIVLNLVSNAVKFTERGEVAVTVELQSLVDGIVELHCAVRDTGPGIPPDKQALIFEAFSQADNSTTRTHGGTGLGLTICTQLVALMQGRIWVESQIGLGSTFHFTLRLARAPASETSVRPTPILPAPDVVTAPVVAPSSQEPRPDNGSTAHLRILVAEDNIVNQKLATALLNHQGHDVTVVGDGRQAAERVAHQPFDLVLMDVHMPVLDGFAAASAIRDHERGTGTHLPIIALTANAMPGDRERCLAVGMDGYLSKPIRREELARAIAGLVPNSRASSVAPADVIAPPVAPVEGAAGRFDPAGPLAQLDGDLELLQELIDLLLEDCPQRVAEMRTALDARDAQALALTAHTLKGALRILQVDTATAAAQRLEQAARAGDWSRIADAAEGLDSQLESLLPEVAEWRQTAGRADNPAIAPRSGLALTA